MYILHIYILTIISLIITIHSYPYVSSYTFQTSLVGSSPFRERLGSNRLPEKPRPRFEHVYIDDFSIVALCQVFNSVVLRTPSFSVDYSNLVFDGVYFFIFLFLIFAWFIIYCFDGLERDIAITMYLISLLILKMYI